MAYCLARCASTAAAGAEKASGGRPPVAGGGYVDASPRILYPFGVVEAFAYTAAGEAPLVVAAQEPHAARAGSAMPRAAVSTIAQVLPSALAVPLCHLSNALKKEENRHAARVWRRFRSREGG